MLVPVSNVLQAGLIHREHSTSSLHVAAQHAQTLHSYTCITCIVYIMHTMDAWAMALVDLCCACLQCRG